MVRDLRRSRLNALLAGSPFYGNRAAFCSAAGITKGRLSQLLDDSAAFGEVAARNLEQSLGLVPLYFDAPASGLTGPEPVVTQIDPPARDSGASATGMEIALLYDLIPASDRVRRTRAYNAATAAILAVLEEKPATEQP